MAAVCAGWWCSGIGQSEKAAVGVEVEVRKKGQKDQKGGRGSFVILAFVFVPVVPLVVCDRVPVVS
jgi:hypothetical protein